MKHGKDDPKGYYAALGLTSTSDDEHIKAAYRRRAMQLHPDRNHGKNTTEQFQFLNEAYAVLSDPAHRAAYDHAAVLNVPEVPVTPEPIKCSRCEKISAQPRIVVFRSVKSFLLFTFRRPTIGVFCSDCAQKQSLKSSASSWLLGWWGFPWGPIYTVQALVTNMLGGVHPPLDNARMLGYQAYYFYATGRPDLARPLVNSALKYCKKVPRTLFRKSADEIERDNINRNLEAFISALGTDSKASRLKNSWKVFSRGFFVQLGVIAAVATGIAIAIVNIPESRYSPPRGPMPYSNQASASPTSDLGIAGQPPVVSSNAPDVAPKKVAYKRPKNAPNGRPWPAAAGYLAGEIQTHKAGLSEITIDNIQNNSDVHLKLVSLAGKVARPARQIFIPAHSRFTIKNLTPGNYDVRYRDLTYGHLSRSESLLLTENTTYKGTEYSVITLTLYKVVNGNAVTFGLSEDEF